MRTLVDPLLSNQDWSLILVADAGLLVVYVLNTGLMTAVTYWGRMLRVCSRCW